jgi:uncharacterized protein YbaR (Trm112 family)
LIGWPIQGNLVSSGKREANDVKKELMDILACPMCKGDLELNVEEEDEKEVVTGSLFCAKCNERYPIVDSIPNLLPPDLRDKAD